MYNRSTTFITGHGQIGRMTVGSLRVGHGVDDSKFIHVFCHAGKVFPNADTIRITFDWFGGFVGVSVRFFYIETVNLT